MTKKGVEWKGGWISFAHYVHTVETYYTEFSFCQNFRKSEFGRDECLCDSTRRSKIRLPYVHSAWIHVLFIDGILSLVQMDIEEFYLDAT